MDSTHRILLLAVSCVTTIVPWVTPNWASAATPGLSEQEIADGWISLFDGETLFGWRKAGNAGFGVKEGAIVASEGEIALLCTTAQFSDYQLRLEFQSDETTNSGIFLHTSPQPKKPGADCYELNIAPADNPFPTGSLVGQRKYADAKYTTAWRRFDVTVVGNTITVLLDGVLLYELQVEHPLGRGYIGLQHNSGRVAFRNICLKPLGLASLFNGENLQGWKEYPEMASQFSVATPGEIHVQGGRGQLESVQSYADFVLQLQCKTHAPRLNSGLFFRTIPGSAMDGYESQIHNGIQNNDPAAPEDCGTGGIFRRVNARRVMASDQAWFSKTIVATGPHVSVWVNGYQVTDWTDERKADANPRRGRRLDAGSFMLQGHDPTTDISFRALYAAELRARGR